MSDNKFHNHLDVCERCRNQPFNLCPLGQAALVKQATGRDIDVSHQRHADDIIFAGMPEGSREVINELAKGKGPAAELSKMFRTMFS